MSQVACIPKVSVIITIYNAEKFIERCVRSLFEQTLENIEYIFINDCTPDASVDILREIIEDYPLRKNQVKIIEHRQNSGVAITRNTGLHASTGLYVIYCDSDDWVEKEMYEKMYNKAIEENADLVGCDFYYDYLKYSCYHKESFDLPKDEQFRRLLYGAMGGYSVIRLVRRELYETNKISFPDGVNMMEDLLVSLKLHRSAQRISYLPEALYHYIQYNANSIVTNVNQQQLDYSIEIVSRIERFLKKSGIWEQYYFEFMERAFGCKMYMVLLPQLRNYKKWHTLWPISNDYIRRYHLSYLNKVIFILANYKLYLLASALQSLKIYIKKIF